MARRAIVLLMLLPMAAILAGCPIVSWIAAVTAPPKSIPPLYQLPKETTVLVLVDDPDQLAADTPVKQELTRELNDLLVEHKVAGKTIPLKIIMQMAAVTPEFAQLRAVDIGRMAEADHVLTIEITEFELKEDPIGHIWKGRLAVNARVYGVEEGRLWPTDRHDGYPVTPATTPTTEDFSPDYGQRLSAKLARETADNVTKLFYEHAGREHYELPPEDVQTSY
jgi:hypothetical protein